MLSALFPEIPWSQICCVGFDLDGTLYDECLFIDQVYRRILDEIAPAWKDTNEVLNFMICRWLEKGSSYPRIFAETWDAFGPAGTDATHFVDRALALFRSFRPKLELPARNRHLLGYLQERFDLFLISDGNPALQRRKFNALGLGVYFPENRRVFTAELGAGHAKPSSTAWHHLQLPHSPEQTVFFGDRDCDATFAERLGLHFQKVYNLVTA